MELNCRVALRYKVCGRYTREREKEVEAEAYWTVFNSNRNNQSGILLMSILIVNTCGLWCLSADVMYGCHVAAANMGGGH